VGGDLYRATGLGAWTLAAVELAGFALAAGAVRAIDPLELAGIRRESGALQITGLYGWVRHPLYLAWMIIVFGAGHMTGDRLAFAAISSFYLVAAVPWEERSLVRAFPEAYPAYARRVPWRIVPYIY